MGDVDVILNAPRRVTSRNTSHPLL